MHHETESYPNNQTHRSSYAHAFYIHSYKHTYTFDTTPATPYQTPCNTSSTHLFHPITSFSSCTSLSGVYPILYLSFIASIILINVPQRAPKKDNTTKKINNHCLVSKKPTTAKSDKKT